jgi:excinuclease ABC subunit C
MPPAELKSLIDSLPTVPGVYRMLGADGAVLYVGKARNLRSRVRQYMRRQGLSARTVAMMQQVRDIGVTVTQSESEALLLENNLIKTWRPRYNVQLRDDKSYPYIFVSDTQEFPRLAFYRGAKREKGCYFGPYPSASAVRASLNMIQKIFRVRQCEDSFFRNRSRPCLQYQIRRCSAPCVGFIDASSYGEDVRHALMFLEGRSRAVGDELIRRMEQASERREYESAALFRDRIAAIKHIGQHQFVSRSGGDADVLAVAVRGDDACIVVTYIRGGLNIGDKTFYPKPGAHSQANEILAAFITQYYLAAQKGPARTIPGRIYVNESIDQRSLIERVFSEQVRKKVRISTAKRGLPRRWIQMAQKNAVEALRRQVGNRSNQHQRLEALRDALGLDATPERIECFDISHTFGEATVAACIVFDQSGAVKAEYRRYNIEGIVGGDDYAALTQALDRRYRRVKEGEGGFPDLLIIDGGKGQVRVAESVLRDLQIEGIRIIGVAKGPARRAGKERLFLSGCKQPTILPPDSGALHLIQQARDEAHRFAIAGHRQRRARTRTSSPLERVVGIGAKRRQALLKNFGGMRGLVRAGIHDLAGVPGISPELARRIFDVIHEVED